MSAMTAAPHVPLVVGKHTTRAEIQAEIAYWRTEQRNAVIASTADEHGEMASSYLDVLLEREPEPA